MDTTIQVATESDRVEIGRLMTAYKMQMSINRLLWKNWPNEKVQQAQTLESVDGLYKDKSGQFLKAVDNKSGEMLGFIFTTRKTPAPAPAAPPPAQPQQPMEIPDRFVPKVLMAVAEGTGAIAKEAEKMEHLKIGAFIVREDKFRQGIGSKLLKEAMDKARAANIPVCAQSEPGSHAFFRKHGFHEKKVVDFDLAEWADPFSGYGILRLILMVWNP